MKYKELFTSYWLWGVVAVEFIIQVIQQDILHGSLFFVEYLGIFLGSFASSLILVSFIFYVIKFFKWIKKKVTKR